MKRSKGFTLIELLAVIVILAIIALIATPIVLNMINEARKSAAKSSTLGYVDSIEYYAGFRQANKAGGINIAGYDVDLPVVSGTEVTTTTVTCSKSGSTWTDGANTTGCSAFMTAVKGKSKGAEPEEATIILDAAGKVQKDTTMKYNGYTCTYDGSNAECAS